MASPAADSPTCDSGFDGLNWMHCPSSMVAPIDAVRPVPIAM